MKAILSRGAVRSFGIRLASSSSSSFISPCSSILRSSSASSCFSSSSPLCAQSRSFAKKTKKKLLKPKPRPQNEEEEDDESMDVDDQIAITDAKTYSKKIQTEPIRSMHLPPSPSKRMKAVMVVVGVGSCVLLYYLIKKNKGRFYEARDDTTPAQRADRRRQVIELMDLGQQNLAPFIDPKQKPLRVMLFGAPGLGKKTQAQKISETLGLDAISYDSVTKTMPEHNYEDTLAGIERVLRDPHVQYAGYLLHNMPLSPRLLPFLKDKKLDPDCIIVLNASPEIASQRLVELLIKNEQHKPKSQMKKNLMSKQFKEEIFGQARKQIVKYMRYTEPEEKRFANGMGKDRVVVINADGTPEEVFTRITDALSKFEPRYPRPPNFNPNFQLQNFLERIEKDSTVFKEAQRNDKLPTDVLADRYMRSASKKDLWNTPDALAIRTEKEQLQQRQSPNQEPIVVARPPPKPQMPKVAQIFSREHPN
eukprot:TRINITY_DN109_c0_g1_i1.p1 TRINITY_DN109_c0_g1~~TRINITY_DN109_c0_g1_i1.p1  ORF type:complete len:478 (-),score=113.96 TRINITY_DN109_c0_g1_i1:116-1549(-)